MNSPDPSGHFIQAALAGLGLTASLALQLVPGVGDGYDMHHQPGSGLTTGNFFETVIDSPRVEIQW